MPKTRYCNVLYMKNPMLEIYQKGADLQNNWYSIAEASMRSIACIPCDQKSTEKKIWLKNVLPNFWGNLIQLLSILGTTKPSEIFFGPSSQRLKICWGQCHGGIGGQQGWMRCHLAVVNPPWLFVLPKGRTWHEPTQDSMEWNWWCFFCSLLLKWAKQNSTPPNPSRTLQSSVDLAMCTWRKQLFVRKHTNLR